MALGSEVTYIVGPPGTGKTVTLAAIVFNHILAGHTVLITAHTNIAVDNAIVKLADHCENSGAKDYLQRGQVIRFGAVDKQSDLCKAKYENVYLPAIAKRRSAHLQRNIDQLETSLKYHEAQLIALKRESEQKRNQWTSKRQQLVTQNKTYNDELNKLQSGENQRIVSLSNMKTQNESSYSFIQGHKPQKTDKKPSRCTTKALGE